MNLLDFIFPKRCVGCGRFGNYFCQSCRLSIRPIHQSETICPVCERSSIAGYTHPNCRTRYTLDGLTSLFHYKGVMGSAVRTIKYRFAFDISKELVSLIEDTFLEDIPQHTAVNSVFVPIPLHKNRLHERGFNQAELLGTLVASRLKVLMYTDILFRTRETLPQVEMKHKKDRLQNMHGVFELNSKTQHVVRNKYVILFDDVFTTGATMAEAASVLKHAGVTRVWAVTMAR